MVVLSTVPLPIVLFTISSLALLYVLFGYPILLGAIARRRQRPIRKAIREDTTVSVLLPVYNGEMHIRGKLDSILALKYPREKVQIIVVSDGSTDATEEIVQNYSSHGVELHVLPHGGKAAALNHAMSAATGEIFFFTDLRQTLEPYFLQRLVSCFADPKVGVVSGELIIRDSNSEEETNVSLYWKYEKWIRKHLSSLDSILGATGSIYAMRRELAVALPNNILLDDVYQPLAAFFRGYRVVMEEQAVAIDYPMALNVEFRRKVRTQAGMFQVLRWYPELLGPRNRMWIHFVSHKLARLLLPYMLIVIAVTSFWLPEPWRSIVLTAQAVFYAVAFLDAIVPEGAAVKRISSPARTFVTLVAAAFCATSIWFVSSKTLWRPTVTSPKPL